MQFRVYVIESTTVTIPLRVLFLISSFPYDCKPQVYIASLERALNRVGRRFCVLGIIGVGDEGLGLKGLGLRCYESPKPALAGAGAPRSS